MIQNRTISNLALFMLCFVTFFLSYPRLNMQKSASYLSFIPPHVIFVPPLRHNTLRTTRHSPSQQAFCFLLIIARANLPRCNHCSRAIKSRLFSKCISRKTPYHKKCWKHATNSQNTSNPAHIIKICSSCENASSGDNSPSNPPQTIFR